MATKQTKGQKGQSGGGRKNDDKRQGQTTRGGQGSDRKSSARGR